MALKEQLREAAHTLGTDHKSLLLARIWDERRREEPDTTWADRMHLPFAVRGMVNRQLGEFKRKEFMKCLTADIVTVEDILRAVDNSENKAAEVMTMGEQPLLVELPHDDLYKSHKTLTEQQVATLLTANGPPASQIFKLDAGRYTSQEVNIS